MNIHYFPYAPYVIMFICENVCMSEFSYVRIHIRMFICENVCQNVHVRMYELPNVHISDMILYNA